MRGRTERTETDKNTEGGERGFRRRRRTRGRPVDCLTDWSRVWRFLLPMVTLSELCLFSHILPQNDALCGEKRVAQWKIVKGRKIGEGRLSSSQPVEPPPKRGRKWGSGVKKWLPRQIQIRGDWVIARGTASEIAKSTRNWGSSAIEIRDAWRKCHREKCGKSWTISR